MEQGLEMGLSEDEAKIIIEMILDDLSATGDFVLFLEALKSHPLPPELVINSTQDFISSMALGKASIARMLVDKDEALIPGKAGMEILERWLRIENESLEHEANNEQED